MCSPIHDSFSWDEVRSPGARSGDLLPPTRRTAWTPLIPNSDHQNRQKRRLHPTIGARMATATTWSRSNVQVSPLANELTRPLQRASAPLGENIMETMTSLRIGAPPALSCLGATETADKTCSAFADTVRGSRWRCCMAGLSCPGGAVQAKKRFCNRLDSVRTLQVLPCPSAHQTRWPGHLQ